MIRILSASSRSQARDSLAIWENEGGASGFSESGAGGPEAPPRWTPTYPIIQGASIEANLRGADSGIADRHVLGVLQVSLALLIPAFAAMGIFWNGSGAQSGWLE